MIPELFLALWVGILALQVVDVVLTASRLPQLSEFAAVRAELLESPGRKLTTEDIEGWREQIAALDARERARAIPAGRTASRQLWRFTPWRLVPALLLTTTLVWLALATARPVSALLFLPLPVIAYVLALAAARASVAAASARARATGSHPGAAKPRLRRKSSPVANRRATASRAASESLAGIANETTRRLRSLRLRMRLSLRRPLRPPRAPPRSVAPKPHVRAGRRLPNRPITRIFPRSSCVLSGLASR